MATWYADHFAGATNLLLASPVPKLFPGQAHGRQRWKTARFEGLPLVTDVVRLMSLRSRHSIFDVRVCSDGGSAAGAADIGIYLSGSQHAGAAVDADRFGSAVDLSVPLDLVSVFGESTNLLPIDRGKKLWELLGLAADPGVDYDLCLTVTTSFTTTNTKLVFIVDYIAGD